MLTIWQKTIPDKRFAFCSFERLENWFGGLRLFEGVFPFVWGSTLEAWKKVSACPRIFREGGPSRGRNHDHGGGGSSLRRQGDGSKGGANQLRNPDRSVIAEVERPKRRPNRPRIDRFAPFGLKLNCLIHELPPHGKLGAASAAATGGVNRRIWATIMGTGADIPGLAQVELAKRSCAKGCRSQKEEK